MKLIAHRGNISRPEQKNENHPEYIDRAIELGFDVEVDLRKHKNELYLGHDTPDYLIDIEWIYKRKDFLWIHCKDLESSKYLSSKSSDLNGIKFFCHDRDAFTLVSTGHIWVHFSELDRVNSDLDESCIVPLLDINLIDKFYNKNVYGICSDYVLEIKNFSR
jgi:hypothetical protein